MITQIYSFLFAICSLSIVIFETNYLINKLFFFFRTNQNINFGYKNACEKNKESNFVYKDSKVVLLINGPTIKHSHKLESGVNKNNFYLNLKSKSHKSLQNEFH